MKKLEFDRKNTLIRRSRKKPAKSCYFCRSRKLKCDRTRPLCGSCSSRSRKQCDYEENTSAEENQLRAKYSKCSKFEMARRIEELESHIAKQPQAYIHKEENPLNNMRYLSSKHNRHILYGPTSYRAILATQTDTFTKYREKIWKVLKLSRNSWKREHHYSTLSEISSIEAVSPQTDSQSVIESLCESLPTYETFQQHLADFFASNFYHSYQIVNEQKVLTDLQDCFVKGPKNCETGCHEITALTLDTKKNYYKVGVMTAIMCLASHPSKVPEAVEVFHKVLTSFVSAKVFYIERVEFLFLRYLYINVAGLDGGDQSHCIFLHGLTVDTAIHMGLNEDLRRLFVNENHPMEEIPYLKRLWLWILFTDVKISLSTGIPLRISDAFAEKACIENYSSPSDILLYKTTSKLRNIMEQIHAREISPNILLIIEDLKEFTRKVFKPLQFYLNTLNLDGNEFTQLQLWHTSLHMLASLSNLHALTCQEYNSTIFNTSILAPLNSLHLCFKVLEGYFELDNHNASSASPCISKKWPHLNSALFLVYVGAFRALIQIYTIFLQYMENKDIQSFTQTNMPIKSQSICSGDIEGPRDGCISLKDVFKEMGNIFDHIHQEKLRPLAQIWQNSYYFSIIVSMEKIGRKAFEKVLKHIDERRKIEEDTSEKNSTTISNDPEEFLMRFSENFAEDISGYSDDFFDTDIYGWSNFEDFFP
ncbi:uncharacterized protein SKDI_16G4510 [Saccharomyces kudriavzevii IFO 1802]|uniref:Uncharacterized protein n=2 Tax=Saccharomyces kudriavzevii (strain ATCC MYA-4449 / AS 2.2408 / CBS 8840 / NBRC 1802 / NCYC 2889) TaxID=226230 RepID=A0AA35J9Y6_SACK1|nr:uncharacterized protein SKDI_16G4510 [Saccharomyces kudriavzevii IFO 1802]EJT42595.1 YKL222C-like protein [Saccharomyces kudriavzevii IFO 1802]CAI4054262.1 hypothetical protein SKDI_16G4510 [Saccharomyces kudriavzevii IFO 1802]